MKARFQAQTIVVMIHGLHSVIYSESHWFPAGMYHLLHGCRGLTLWFMDFRCGQTVLPMSRLLEMLQVGFVASQKTAMINCVIHVNPNFDDQGPLP